MPLFSTEMDKAPPMTPPLLWHETMGVASLEVLTGLDELASLRPSSSLSRRLPRPLALFSADDLSLLPLFPPPVMMAAPAPAAGTAACDDDGADVGIAAGVHVKACTAAVGIGARGQPREEGAGTD